MLGGPYRCGGAADQQEPDIAESNEAPGIIVIVSQREPFPQLMA